jgi:hypothetical protein
MVLSSSGQTMAGEMGVGEAEVLEMLVKLATIPDEV